MRLKEAVIRLTRVCLPLFAVTLCASATGEHGSGRGQAARPNVVWFVVDDMSASFSCYGERRIQTPNIDRLASEGVRFSRAFVTAPVCSPSRSGAANATWRKGRWA